MVDGVPSGVFIVIGGFREDFYLANATRRRSVPSDQHGAGWGVVPSSKCVTFGAGCFVYTVPGSAENMLLWPTGRGNYLRDGRPWPGKKPLFPPAIQMLLFQ